MLNLKGDYLWSFSCQSESVISPQQRTLKAYNWSTGVYFRIYLLSLSCSRGPSCLTYPLEFGAGRMVTYLFKAKAWQQECLIGWSIFAPRISLTLYFVKLHLWVLGLQFLCDHSRDANWKDGRLNGPILEVSRVGWTMNPSNVTYSYIFILARACIG